MGQGLKSEKAGTDLMSMGVGLIIFGIILYVFVMVYLNQSTTDSAGSGKTHTIGGVEIDEATYQKLISEARKKGYSPDKSYSR